MPLLPVEYLDYPLKFISADKVRVMTGWGFCRTICCVFVVCIPIITSIFIPCIGCMFSEYE